MRPSAASCRRSPRAPMSRRSTASSRRRWPRRACALADIDAIAATAGPGLVGGLIVGLMTAKAIAAAAGKPLIAINHLEGHALTARLTDGARLSLPAAAGLRRPHPDRAGARRRRLSSAGPPPSTTRSARPSTRPPRCSACPIPAGRIWRRRRSRGDAAPLCPAAAAAGRRAARLLLLRPEDRGAPGGRRRSAPLTDQDVADLAAVVPGGDRRALERPCRTQPGAFPRRISLTCTAPRWWSPAASPPTARSGTRCEALSRAAGFAFVAPPHGSAPTMPR